MTELHRTGKLEVFNQLFETYKAELREHHTHVYGACPSCGSSIMMTLPCVVGVQAIHYISRDTAYYGLIPILQKYMTLYPTSTVRTTAHIISEIFTEHPADGTFEIPEFCPSEATIEVAGAKMQQTSHSIDHATYSHQIFTLDTILSSALSVNLKQSFTLDREHKLHYVYCQLYPVTYDYKVGNPEKWGANLSKVEERELSIELDDGTIQTENLLLTTERWRIVDKFCSANIAPHKLSATKTMAWQHTPVIKEFFHTSDPLEVFLGTYIIQQVYADHNPAKLGHSTSYKVVKWIKENPTLTAVMVSSAVLFAWTLYLTSGKSKEQLIAEHLAKSNISQPVYNSYSPVFGKMANCANDITPIPPPLPATIEVGPEVMQVGYISVNALLNAGYACSGNRALAVLASGVTTLGHFVLPEKLAVLGSSITSSMLITGGMSHRQVDIVFLGCIVGGYSVYRASRQTYKVSDIISHMRKRLPSLPTPPPPPVEKPPRFKLFRRIYGDGECWGEKLQQPAPVEAIATTMDYVESNASLANIWMSNRKAKHTLYFYPRTICEVPEEEATLPPTVLSVDYTQETINDRVWYEDEYLDWGNPASSIVTTEERQTCYSPANVGRNMLAALRQRILRVPCPYDPEKVKNSELLIRASSGLINKINEDFEPECKLAPWLQNRRLAGKGKLDANTLRDIKAFKNNKLDTSTYSYQDIQHYLGEEEYPTKKLDLLLKLGEKFPDPNFKPRTYCRFSNVFTVLTGPYWFHMHNMCSGSVPGYCGNKSHPELAETLTD